MSATTEIRSLAQQRVEEFAERRGTNDSPYKWEIYLHSQEYYLRFVCYKAIQELLDISYPTVIKKLDELILALGYEIDPVAERRHVFRQEPHANRGPFWLAGHDFREHLLPR